MTLFQKCNIFPLGFSLFLLLQLGLLQTGCLSESETSSPDLVVYTYDSLTAKNALGSQVQKAFEKKCQCRVKLQSVGDAGALATRLEIEGSQSRADIVWGLDQDLWKRVQQYAWKGAPEWTPSGWDELEVSVGEGFYPFDYGVFTFMVDHEELKARGLKPPTHLKDLQKSQWRRNFIVQDPRTSTPGLAFVRWVQKVEGRHFNDRMKRLSQQWLTLPAGWDTSYGLFLKQEAPLVWSYTTSQAYHRMHGDQKRYEAILFPEGHLVQVEGAMIHLNSKGEHLKRAKEFISFLISPEVQAWIPETQWMYPARKSVPLPQAFADLPKPKLIATQPLERSELQALLEGWRKAVQ